MIKIIYLLGVLLLCHCNNCTLKVSEQLPEVVAAKEVHYDNICDNDGYFETMTTPLLVKFDIPKDFHYDDLRKHGYIPDYTRESSDTIEIAFVKKLTPYTESVRKRAWTEEKCSERWCFDKKTMLLRSITLLYPVSDLPYPEDEVL